MTGLIGKMPASSLFQIFKNRHVVLPVIHVRSLYQALRNVEIAVESGADGVFLINHSIDADQLLAIHAEVCREYPGWFVGVNCLGVAPEDVFERLSPEVNGVWVDNAVIDERQHEQHQADVVSKARIDAEWNGLYFGGVAFKYQRGVDDLASASRIARRYMDVVTTSGSGTGNAAKVDKIRTMKEALGDFPLAIASGISPDNIHDYLPHSDCYLVATGISRSVEELDPLLVARLVGVVRAYDGQSRNINMNSRWTKESHTNSIVNVNWTSGLVFELNLAAFAEPDPVFAYWDDSGSQAKSVIGLNEAGYEDIDRNGVLHHPDPATISAFKEGRWMGMEHGMLHCKLFKASGTRSENAIASLQSLRPGEFDVKIFHVRPDRSTELLWCDNFNIK